MLTKNNLMNYPTAHNALNCDLKDAQGLNDFQQMPAEYAIEIPQVGITNFRLPIQIQGENGKVTNHDATASMAVNLAPGNNGINMSRLVAILQRETEIQVVDFPLMTKIIHCFQKELQDNGTTKQAYLKLHFSYCTRQKSLKSNHWGYQYYPVSLQVRSQSNGNVEYFLTLDFEYSSTCPCSLSMARQYEREFAQGLASEGIGIGIPHSQRSRLRCRLQLAPHSAFFLDDFVKLLRQIIPTETLSLAKRADEQAFAILNGMHPMFVEQVARKLSLELNSIPQILDWWSQIEHFESLHSHNAAAVIAKNPRKAAQWGEELF